MIRRFLIILSLASIAAGAAVASDMAVTIYNSNLGVISETRQLEFSKGAGRLAFRDVPSQIDPASVRFELVDDGRNVGILEQNYAFDLVSPEKLFTKYIDQEIELIGKDGSLYSGTLLAFSGQAVTILDPGGKIKILSMENITETNFPQLPDGLITKPTLFWLYQSDYSGKLDCRVGYQTGGLSWSAEYIGVLDQDEKNLDLSGWSSINNTSGKTYNNAKLKLIAGDIHRAGPSRKARRPRVEMLSAAPATGFEEKAFFEYHMYTLPRRATLADKEIKQISLFDPASTSVNKVYYYRPDQNPTDVTVMIEFQNSKETGLGMPLPAGRVRLFKADDDGALVLLGEDRIGHTPKDEDVALTVGTAFDIKAEQTILNQTRISPKINDREFEIELRNRKSEAVIIKVEKQLWGFWEVTESSLEYEKKDATTLAFEVPVEAEKTVKIRFTVRFTNR